MGAHRVMQALTGGSQKKVNIDRFREFASSHPALLFPAFEMQRNIQKKILGVRFWDRLLRKRFELCEGEYISVHRLMNTKVNSAAFDEFIAKPLQEAGASPSKQLDIALQQTGTRAERRERNAAQNAKTNVRIAQAVGKVDVLATRAKASKIDRSNRTYTGGPPG